MIRSKRGVVVMVLAIARSLGKLPLRINVRKMRSGTFVGVLRVVEVSVTSMVADKWGR